MTVIDGKWLTQHLRGERGEKANLARAMGINPDQLSKVLTGKREVQADEIPGALEFFGLSIEGRAGDTAIAWGMEESEAEPFNQTGSQRSVLEALARAGRPVRQPESYRMRRSAPGFGLMAGDSLLVDGNATPAPGDLVLVTQVDTDTGEGTTLLRRMVPPWLISDDPSHPPLRVDDDDQSIATLGVIRGSYRRIGV